MSNRSNVPLSIANSSAPTACPHRRVAARTGHKCDLTERLTGAECLHDPLGAVVVDFDDLERARADDVEGVGEFALPDHGGARADFEALDPSGEVVEDVDRQVVEQRQRIEQLGRFDAPPALRAEPRPLEQDADPARDRPRECDAGRG